MVFVVLYLPQCVAFVVVVEREVLPADLNQPCVLALRVLGDPERPEAALKAVLTVIGSARHHAAIRLDTPPLSITP